MEDKILQAIYELSREVKSIKSELNDFREETKKEFNQINVKLDRLEENQPKDITAHLKHIQNVDNKTELLNKRLFDVESRLKN
ncbi:MULTISPECIES: hypothetical protein [Bacillus amyloliquefaciens group]|uniref:hypothetical protein n=1 Tax=Bacillus amyloliquefaciens group TaxID=1938374 RepID=UPI00080C3F03|nr:MULTISPECIES: hypothetical protein [Bacillus amyloliquefaciens group]MDH3078539.1 hypothetical protein [Bacillus amyloliquefaciens]MDH3103666.1 hypothetical protein [Bacillus velezensis]OCB99044.1 hypothetical protein SRCM101294_00133 [Bacillus amyloliquefaciens]QZY42715.1 hypothetical protein K4A81_06250 [Bacillus velezensis]